MRKLAWLLLCILAASMFAVSQQDESDKGRTAAAPAEASQPNDSSRPANQNSARDRQDSLAAHAEQIPAHTEVHATLDTPLSNKTSRAGDRFTATVSLPIHDSNGAALIPTGSKLMGEIADSPHSQLLVRFTEITSPSGQKIPIASSLLVGNGKEVNLPAQTPLVLRLDKTVMVPASSR